MKKIHIMSLLLLSMLLCAVILVSCGGDDLPPDPDTDTPSVTDPETTPPDQSTSAATEGLTFKLNEEGDGYVVSGMGSVTDTDIIIPAKHEGLPVVGIATYAFSPASSNAAKTLVSVTIPEGVTYIESQAFRLCDALTTLRVPSTLTHVESDAVYKCDEFCYQITDMISYLGNEENPHIVLVKANVTNLESYSIHADTKVIAGAAFDDCSKATSIPLPQGLISIGKYAFADCKEWNDFSLPNSLTYIEDYAFMNCSKITEISLPASVKDFGVGAFAGTGISSFTMPAGMTVIPDLSFYNCYRIKSFTIPNGITTIGKRAFSDTGLTSIDIPASVTTIDTEAFHHCTNLASVTFHEGLKTIGKNAFAYSSLTTLTLPEGVITVGEQAFRTLDDYTTVTLPGSIANWGENIFYEASIDHLILAEGFTALKKEAFYQISEIRNVTLPDTIQMDGWHDDIYGIKKVTLPANATKITAGCMPAWITTLYVTAGIQDIDPNLFDTCKNILTLELNPANATYQLKNNCLIRTSSKTLVRAVEGFVIPADGTVTTIGSKAFKNFAIRGYGKQTIDLPKQITLVEEEAFYDCKISSFTFRERIKFGKNVFRDITDISFTYCGTKSTLKSYQVVFTSPWYVTGTAQIQCTDGRVSASDL